MIICIGIDIASPPGQVRLLEAGSGNPVLFMNGIGAPAIGMAPLAGRLPGHRHLLVDLPGHGLSLPYQWQGAPVRLQAVDILAELLDGLAVEQVTLVGNSLGGLFALWFASTVRRVSRCCSCGAKTTCSSAPRPASPASTRSRLPAS